MQNVLTIEKEMNSPSRKNISTVIGQFGKRLLGFIRKRVNNEADAEDILQDVWYQFTATAEPIEQLGSWLFTVARNKITDRYRKKKPEFLEDLLSGEDEEGVGEARALHAREPRGARVAARRGGPARRARVDPARARAPERARRERPLRRALGLDDRARARRERPRRARRRPVRRRVRTPPDSRGRRALDRVPRRLEEPGRRVPGPPLVSPQLDRIPVRTLRGASWI